MPLDTEVPRPSDVLLDGDPAPPKVHGSQFSARVYCGQTAGWMKMPLIGTEGDLSPGHIVLDGDTAPRERGTAAPLFSAHVSER